MTKSPKSKTSPDLSIVILNYKTEVYTGNCLKSIFSSDLGKYKIEVIVADNDSGDDSIKNIKKIPFSHPCIDLKFVCFDQNHGFARGNNLALCESDPQSKYVLFLNSDTILEKDTLYKSLDFMENNPQIDASTCNVILALTGKTQPECHRGFPTPWNTFWHFFGFGIPKLFPKTASLHGYLNDHLDFTKVQKIDCFVGAFILLKRSVGNDIGWWNEKYYFYGEDLDFAYKLYQKGYSLYFNPGTKITHYQGMSSGIAGGQAHKRSAASRATKVRTALNSTNAMEVFVKENLINKYPLPLQWLLLLGIKLLKLQRFLKAKFF